MAVLGIVPIAAHAQPITINELMELTETGTQTSAPQQDATAAVVDDDTNTNTPVNFVIQATGAFSTATTTITAPFIATDDDSNTAAVGATQTAPLTQTQDETQTGTQTGTAVPTATEIDLLGLLPTSG